MTRKPARLELLDLCNDGIVPVAKWSNRDTAEAQIQLGKAKALLSAGCGYSLTSQIETTDSTWWIDIEWPGFGHFDYGGDVERETFYIPTRTRLDLCAGRDWY